MKRSELEAIKADSRNRYSAVAAYALELLDEIERLKAEVERLTRRDTVGEAQDVVTVTDNLMPVTDYTADPTT